MNQLNNLILEGKVLNDPEVVAKNTETGEKLVKFTIENVRYYRDAKGKCKKETFFMVCQCWAELGEKTVQNIKRGMVVRAVGRLTMDRWKNKEGECRTSTELVCNHLEYRAEESKKLAVIEENETGDYDDYFCSEEDAACVD